MLWIHDKIRKLKKSLPNLSYEDYFHRASQEWGYRKHLTKKEKQPEKAALSPLQLLDNKAYNEILNQILRKIVQTHGTLTWQADSFAIGIEDYQEWKDLISRLLVKGDVIRDWYNGHGAFHFENHEGRASLHFY